MSPVTTMSDAAERMMAAVRRGGCSFVELETAFGSGACDDGAPGVDRVIHCLDWPGRPNLVIWAGFSSAFQKAFDEIKSAVDIRPTSLLVYLADGKCLTLPIAKKLRAHKKPHWIPCVLNPKGAA